MSKRLVAKTGTYKNQQGEQKNRYVDIGVILSNQNGEYVLLDPGVNLAGILIKQNDINGESRTNVMCSIFDGDNRR